MEGHTMDFVSNFGNSRRRQQQQQQQQQQRDDGGDGYSYPTTDCSTQLFQLSSTSQVPILSAAAAAAAASASSSSQIVNPQMIVDSQPVRRFTPVRRGRGEGGGTCPRCMFTFRKEDKQHFRYVYKGTPEELRLCNKCYFKDPAVAQKIAEKKAKKKAEAAEKKAMEEAAMAAEKKAREEAAMCALKL